MSKKLVSVSRPDGTVAKHISYPEAFSLVKSQQAEWIDEQRYRAIRLFDSRVLPRGLNNTFLDVWQLRPSGGIPVWQMRTA